jgi:hypothetical protein
MIPAVIHAMKRVGPVSDGLAVYSCPICEHIALVDLTNRTSDTMRAGDETVAHWLGDLPVSYDKEGVEG